MSLDTLPFGMIPAEVAFDGRLTLTQLRVLVALFTFRNRSTGMVFPTRAKIAARTGIAETRVSATTSQLQALGWLVKRGNGGRSAPCQYEIQTPMEVSEALHGSIEVEGERRATRSRHSGAVGVTDSVTETVTSPVTVTEPVTVTDSVTKTVTDSVTKRLLNPSRAKNRPRTDQVTDQQTVRGSRFREFWEAWPSGQRKRARHEAEGIWTRGGLDAMADAIITDVRTRERMDQQWIRGYAPMPTTYLRGRRWEDEMGGPTPEKGGGTVGTTNQDAVAAWLGQRSENLDAIEGEFSRD